MFGCNTSRRVKRIENILMAFSREALEILRTLERNAKLMSTAMEDLQREVAEATAVSESAVALIGGLAQQIRDLKDDPAKLEELASRLDASSNALAAAVAANTVAEGEDDEEEDDGAEEPTEPTEPTEPSEPIGDDTNSGT